MENKTEKQQITIHDVMKDITDYKYNRMGYNAVQDFIETYVAQEREKGVIEGFNAAREKTYKGSFYNQYPTITDYLNSKNKP